MRWLLMPLAWIYAAIIYLRWKFYKWGVLKSKKAPAPVISVGNIALGGTGKTPCTIWLTKRLKEMGFEPVILTRGYKRKQKGNMVIYGENPEAILAGDEPALMASKLPGVDIVVDKDRVSAAKHYGASPGRVFILDDGFQHMQIARDFDILLLPAEDPLSGGHLFPVGRLRDGAWRIAESDVLVIVGNRSQSDDIRHLGYKGPIYVSKKKLVSIKTRDDRILDQAAIRGQKVLAFAGIARPESFRETLEQAGIEVVQLVAYPDHYYYKASDIEDIEAAAEEYGANILITTEKDVVRLTALDSRLQIMVAQIEFTLDKPEEFLDLIIKSIGEK